MRIWMMLALGAAIFWGSYVPAIAAGQLAFGATNPNRSMRAFLFIGLAYFVMAVVVPGIWLTTNPSPADAGFTLKGGILSTLAGILGAAGALGVVFSLKFGGTPLYVAPVVFAGAPIVNVLISWLIDFLHARGQAPKPMFLVGLILAVVGTTLVLLNSPSSHGPPKSAAANPTTTPH